jgi:hypothetical protein
MDVKVCHFTTAHSINDNRIFTKQCVSLAANGFDVTLIAFGDEEFEDVKNRVKRISLNLPVKNRIERFVKRSKVIWLNSKTHIIFFNCFNFKFRVRDNKW